jgi:hypothetical protein
MEEILKHLFLISVFSVLFMLVTSLSCDCVYFNYVLNININININIY